MDVNAAPICSCVFLNGILSSFVSIRFPHFWSVNFCSDYTSLRIFPTERCAESKLEKRGYLWLHCTFDSLFYYFGRVNHWFKILLSTWYFHELCVYVIHIITCIVVCLFYVYIFLSFIITLPTTNKLMRSTYIEITLFLPLRSSMFKAVFQHVHKWCASFHRPKKYHFWFGIVRSQVWEEW